MIKKYIYAFCMSILLISILLPDKVSAVALEGNTTEDFRAVWVCSVTNMDFPSKKGLDNNELKKEINFIISKSVELKLNAIILQVRPTGDALYKSDIFPWSEYLSGIQGVAPKDGFDPLSYWIEQAHKNNLQLHAWINPYRITFPSAKITNVNRLSANNPARKSPSLVIAYKNALYYDPGLPENKKLIIDGIAEIVKNYDIDGIHLDDYFYPGTDFPDNGSYRRYGAGMNRNDWRRENVNDVIKGIQKTITELTPDVRFGVSPFAIWLNRSSSSLGSDTDGTESYKSMFADTRRWVKEGWLDYICPQIYWYSGYRIADYRKVLHWWANVCYDTDVDLYIGHAAYREAGNERNWRGEMVRQLTLNNTVYQSTVKGSVFFRFSSLKGSLGQQIASYYTY